MASVNVKFDTITKNIDVTIDGQKVDNVSEVIFDIFAYDGKDTGYVDIKSVEYNDDHKMITTTRISADEQRVISTTSNTDTREKLSKAIFDVFNLEYH